MESGIQNITALRPYILFVIMALIIIAILKLRQKYTLHNSEKDREKITGWIPPAPGRKWDVFDRDISEQYSKELNRRIEAGEETSDLF